MSGDGGNPEVNFTKKLTAGGREFRGAKSQMELKADKRKLTEVGRTDFLTGLPNRRQLDTDLKAAISEFERNKFPFSILSIDLRDFKEINEKLGHAAGDKALQFFGNFLSKHIRALDRPSRPGGDEFMVILEETNQQEADLVLKHLQQSLEEAKKVLGDSHEIEQMVDMRISAKEWNEKDTYEIFMKDLDRKMYEEKRGVNYNV